MSVYLITGATSDIGLELIKTVAKEGDKFLLQGFGDETALTAFCTENGIDYTYFNVNLSDSDETDRFVEAVKETGLVPTHFVHLPALRVVNTKFKSFDEERFLLDLNVQVMSAVKICKYIMPKMAKAKFGRVLFMATSYVLANPPKNTGAYIMAKNAIVGLMKSLATDYVSNGITVNSVSPSMIETKFLAETSHLIVEAAANDHPMKRNAQVNDVVPAMAFLLCEEARFITGVNLPVTGGSVIE
ncbi:MAG: SDR family oxidoreductase [Oscillospiraceae bacterium]|nr:SDR family oxidoreductase [Oscillospiraceae bacterium]